MQRSVLGYLPSHMIPAQRLLMRKELSSRKVLAFRCPTCGAAPVEKCELTSGRPRTEPHRDRRLIAKDQPERISGEMSERAVRDLYP